MKTGILGGTFDPIHNGHLYLAKKAHDAFDLDRVWLMPANTPYFKTREGHRVTAAELRLEMTRLAAGTLPYTEASDFELQCEGNTYTSDTISRLSELYPEDSFYFIMGADSLYKLDTWYKPEVLLKKAVILCADREDPEITAKLSEVISSLESRFASVSPDIRRIECNTVDISSTEIRSLIEKGEDVSQLLPESVYDFIKERGLYRPDTIL